MNKIAHQIFDGCDAQNKLRDQLEEVQVQFNDVGWDDYDNSLELIGVPASYRLSAEAQRIVYEAGFSKVYMNHLDKWETHYGFELRNEFAMSTGWRVSYPHKRGSGERGILVEQVPATWPKSWVETGYVSIVSPSDYSVNDPSGDVPLSDEAPG